MSTQPGGSTPQPHAPIDKMSPAHMLSIIVGDLLGAGSLIVFANSGPVLAGLLMLVAGLALIILGAAGLGSRMSAVPAMASLNAGIRPDTDSNASYPARLEGQLDPNLTRWMWLFKWLLAIPHYIVLAFLWVAFIVVTVAAGITILFTSHYPPSLFRFNVGVMRWHWRVAFYATGVMGTDNYPPFTLARTGYPATFDVEQPAKLSRWQVLVKSWLFALPHLIIVGLLTGSVWSSTADGGTNGMSLLGLLVFITAVILLFTGVYRMGLFNLIMGINRWMYRTISYTALMSDDYPPFRLDQGPQEPPIRTAVAL
ncbi:hypothetical protein GCM10027404_12930 [Arthrobacter tumbae]|uniref:DUF4389 domain-containing protein n=1 Tax=Arthrobacter tumbae TaxID=163874 RepID=UPI00195EE408|nr:DUF4389 domain-containing protein [Arthrobacter tumbae]MBM7782576.1 hypothetical protein [Arthrobacter tumbae]